jgi:acyl-coenzyme A thioesterase PaaI-like protein
VEEVAGGRAIGSMRAGPQHANPMGTLHSGVLCDLADAAINFFRPVWQADQRAEGRIVNRGKNVGYVECDVTDQGGKLIATATSTCVVLSASTRNSADRLRQIRLQKDMDDDLEKMSWSN